MENNQAQQSLFPLPVEIVLLTIGIISSVSTTNINSVSLMVPSLYYVRKKCC